MSVRGPIALHGGGEFQPGDERVLADLLDLADPTRIRPLRVAVVPTAAARGRPTISAAHGVAAFRRVAADADRPIEAKATLVVDLASATDLLLAADLESTDVIYLPGGDPDLVVSVLRGSPAWDAILGALARGAVVAGASAGAMGFAESTWTADGIVDGLGLVRGLAVAPHADASTWSDVIGQFGSGRPGHVGILGIAERTALIIHDESWRVVGEGEVRWIAPDTDRAVVLRDGDRMAAPV